MWKRARTIGGRKELHRSYLTLCARHDDKTVPVKSICRIEWPPSHGALPHVLPVHMLRGSCLLLSASSYPLNWGFFTNTFENLHTSTTTKIQEALTLCVLARLDSKSLGQNESLAPALLQPSFTPDDHSETTPQDPAQGGLGSEPAQETLKAVSVIPIFQASSTRIL